MIIIEKIIIKNKEENIRNKKCKATYFNKNIFIILIILFLYKSPSNNNIRNKIYIKYRNSTINIIRNDKLKNHKYYYCFCARGRMENLYARELISYYLNIGADKFVIADNNIQNDEKFSDVLQDYINKGKVDILDIINQFYGDSEIFEIMYQEYKDRCEWLSFFDFDEYLVMNFGKKKNLKAKKFLKNRIFDDCEAIQFNWLLYSDNNLIHYDNRPLVKRFKPEYNHRANFWQKLIVRGNLNKRIFIANKSCHIPDKDVKLCDSLGNKKNLKSPIFENGYLMHFNTKTVEEYITKIKRGHKINENINIELYIQKFFDLNKFTKEKLKIFEKYFNRTFPKFHNKAN